MGFRNDFISRFVAGVGILLILAISPAFSKENWMISLEKDLQSAASSGNLAQTKKLLNILVSGGGSPEFRDQKGRTLLFYAGNKEIASVLIQKGLDPSVRDNGGNSAADAAGEKKLYELALFLQKQITVKPNARPQGSFPVPVPSPTFELPPLPSPSKTDVYIYLNRGNPFDLNLGSKFLRIRALVRVDKAEAIRLGFIKKDPQNGTPFEPTPYGKGERPFTLYDFKMVEGLSTFFYNARFIQGSFYQAKWVGKDKRPVPLTRQQIRHTAALYLRNQLSLTWVKELIFPTFLVNN